MSSFYPYPEQPHATISPNDRLSEKVQEFDSGDIANFVGLPQSGPPFRPGIYQLSWNGIETWQTWSKLEYPPAYRVLITKGAAADTAQVHVLNNPPYPVSNAPIAIQDYVVSTQMIWAGGGEI